jgi:peptide/nickel transport system permease protein
MASSTAEPLRQRPAAGVVAFLSGGRAPASVVLAGIVLVVIALWALVPGIAPKDPAAQDVVRGIAGPGDGHVLGTDDLGRDVLSRVIAGARRTAGGALLIALGTVSIATLLGLLAGYLGGLLDSVLSRLADVLFALPELLIAIVVVGTLGGGYLLGVAVLIVLSVPQTFRLIRAATLEQRVKPYIEACRTLNLSRTRVMARHILPNVFPMVLAALFLRFTYGTIGLASLSFLGLGSAPGDPEWGRMVADNRTYLLESGWSTLAPAFALMLMCVSANLVGDWLYERLSSRGVSR